MPVTHYLVFVSGQQRWLTFVEAYEMLGSHLLKCSLGDQVILEDGSKRQITEEERENINVAAERYSSTYR